MEKKKKAEQRKKEVPIIDFGISFGGILKGIGDFVEGITKLAEKGQEVQKLSEMRASKPIRGMYGFNFRVGPKGPSFQKFGTIKPTLELEGEEREPLVDVFEEDNEITVIAELPGIEEKDISVDLEENTLSISAETKGRKYSKEIELPADISGEPELTYNNGVLEMKLEKKAE